MERTLYMASLGQTGSGGAMHVATPVAVVAIFNVDGCLHAIDDACLRCGASLARGLLASLHVACPGCGLRYDLTTGRVHGVPALCTDTFAVHVVDSRVQVDDTPRLSPR